MSTLTRPSTRPSTFANAEKDLYIYRLFLYTTTKHGVLNGKRGLRRKKDFCYDIIWPSGVF